MKLQNSRYNLSQIIWAGAMFVFLILSYVYWNTLKISVLDFLKSELTTFSIIALLSIIAALHFKNNFDEPETAINSNGGPLEKPIDYLQFIGTYSTILIAAQTFSREFLILSSFQSISTCQSFGTFDKVSFACCVIVLITYSYVRIKPVVFEAFVKKESIIPNSELDDVQLAAALEKDKDSSIESE